MGFVRSVLALVAGLLVPISLSLFAVRVGYWLVPCEYLGDAMLEHCSLQPIFMVLNLIWIAGGGYFAAAAEPPSLASHLAVIGIALTIFFLAVGFVASPSESTNPSWILLVTAVGAIPATILGARLRRRREPQPFVSRTT